LTQKDSDWFKEKSEMTSRHTLEMQNLKESSEAEIKSLRMKIDEIMELNNAQKEEI